MLSSRKFETLTPKRIAKLMRLTAHDNFVVEYILVLLSSFDKIYYLNGNGFEKNKNCFVKYNVLFLTDGNCVSRISSYLKNLT